VVKEWGENVVFLRKIEEGACDHSYGIQVAKLAGLPNTLLNRAKEILSNLEAEELTANNLPKLAASKNGYLKKNNEQLDIFEKQEQVIRTEIQNLKLDEMTPLQALNKLNELKSTVDEAN